MIGLLTIHLDLSGCRSLKDKRSVLKPLLNRLHREFNISVAEMDLHDRWAEALIGCSMIANDHAYLQRALTVVLNWIEANWPEGQVFDHSIEII